MSLLTQKHKNSDFFIADIFDQTPFKDDMASMEHPVFTLSTKPDLRVLEYKNGDTSITVSPSIYGLPTIFDKDILLYCASLLMAEVNQGRTPPPTLRISPHDFLKTTNRTINGQSYTLFEKALDRLSGCRIKTNIKTGKTDGEKSGFGVIDSWRIIESHKVKNRMVRVEVTVSNWFYNSIVDRKMLTINPNYFRLRKPMERRLYEIARKHCGNQKQWSISLQNLFIKSGSSGTLRLFKSRFKAIVQDGHIPDYKYSLDDKNKVTIVKNNYVETVQIEQGSSLHDRALSTLKNLKKNTISRAKKIHEESYTDWSLQDIAIQYVQYMEKTGAPTSLDGSFIGFLKNKVTTYKKDAVTP